MIKKEKVIGSLVVLAILGSVVVFSSRIKSIDTSGDSGGEEIFKIESTSKNKEVQNGVKDSNTNGQIQENSITEKIVVEIKGEVNKPDVYKLPVGSRIDELIDEAGGLTLEANIDMINRATLLEDGQCIIISNVNNPILAGENLEVQNDFMSNPSTDKNKNGKVNINTATIDDLKKLNGIGDSKAEAIIEYRESIGKFKSIEDIKSVSGIGEKTFEKIKDGMTI
ncbi:MAG: helix-hairpin-helix domain-containing protein [Sarcina sp.]